MQFLLGSAASDWIGFHFNVFYEPMTNEDEMYERTSGKVRDGSRVCVYTDTSDEGP